MSRFGEPIKKVRILRRDHGGRDAQLLGELTLFATVVVATYYDEDFERELGQGIHDHRSGEVIGIEHGALFIEVLQRRYCQSSTTWVATVSLS